jgi:cyclase
MLTKRIIPCLDVKDGVVVKGIKFLNHKKVGSIIEILKEPINGKQDLLLLL